MDLKLFMDVRSGSAQPTTTLSSDIDLLPFLRLGSTSGAAKVTRAQVPVAAESSMRLADIDAIWRYMAHALSSGTARTCLVGEDQDRKFIDARSRLLRYWAPSPDDVRTNAQLRMERLIRVKSAFGLSTSDLAKVCRISRTQIYKWLSPDEALHLTVPNWKRLADLARFAEDWTALSTKPARALLNGKLPDSPTLLELLSAEQLDHRAIRTGMQVVAATLAASAPRRDEQLRRMGVNTALRPGQLSWDE